jgi:hypothetical protein
MVVYNNKIQFYEVCTGGADMARPAFSCLDFTADLSCSAASAG